jgi:hypothetical protein
MERRGWFALFERQIVCPSFFAHVMALYLLQRMQDGAA